MDSQQYLRAIGPEDPCLDFITGPTYFIQNSQWWILQARVWKLWGPQNVFWGVGMEKILYYTSLLRIWEWTPQKHIIHFDYHSCCPFQVLLHSDKSDSNFSDRTLLKNLGHWLGMLTIAKNKPILQIVSTMFLLVIDHMFGFNDNKKSFKEWQPS